MKKYISFQQQVNSQKKNQQTSTHELSKRFLVVKYACNYTKQVYKNQYYSRNNIENESRQLKHDKKTELSQLFNKKTQKLFNQSSIYQSKQSKKNC